MWRLGSCERSSRSRARGAVQRGSVVHRARQGVCGDEFTVCRIAEPSDEVSHQLYTECKRIDGVQETVNACKARNSRPSITSSRGPIRC